MFRSKKMVFKTDVFCFVGFLAYIEIGIFSLKRAVPLLQILIEINVSLSQNTLVSVISKSTVIALQMLELE